MAIKTILKAENDIITNAICWFVANIDNVNWQLLSPLPTRYGKMKRKDIKAHVMGHSIIEFTFDSLEQKVLFDLIWL